MYVHQDGTVIATTCTNVSFFLIITSKTCSILYNVYQTHCQRKLYYVDDYRERSAPLTADNDMMVDSNTPENIGMCIYETALCFFLTTQLPDQLSFPFRNTSPQEKIQCLFSNRYIL